MNWLLLYCFPMFFRTFHFLQRNISVCVPLILWYHLVINILDDIRTHTHTQPHSIAGNYYLFGATQSITYTLAHTHISKHIHSFPMVICDHISCAMDKRDDNNTKKNRSKWIKNDYSSKIQNITKAERIENESKLSRLVGTQYVIVTFLS